MAPHDRCSHHLESATRHSPVRRDEPRRSQFRLSKDLSDVGRHLVANSLVEDDVDRVLSWGIGSRGVAELVAEPRSVTDSPYPWGRVVDAEIERDEEALRRYAASWVRLSLYIGLVESREFRLIARRRQLERASGDPGGPLGRGVRSGGGRRVHPTDHADRWRPGRHFRCRLHERSAGLGSRTRGEDDHDRRHQKRRADDEQRPPESGPGTRMPPHFRRSGFSPRFGR